MKNNTKAPIINFLIIAVVLSILIIFLYSKSNKQKNVNLDIANDGQKLTNTNQDSFKGDKGNLVKAEKGFVYIDESEVSDGNLHSFHFNSEKYGKSIYFFILKASDGTYRAAANACEVCYGSKLGFSQVGEQIRCENCRTIYSKDQIAMQKGGCNPRPIDKDVEVIDGKLKLDIQDIENSADLF